MKKYLLILACTAIAVAACDKSNTSLAEKGVEQTGSISEGSVITEGVVEMPPYADGTATIGFYSTSEWRLEGLPDWITSGIDRGRGSEGLNTITLVAKAASSASDYVNGERRSSIAVRRVADGVILRTLDIVQKRPYIKVSSNQTAPEVIGQKTFRWNQYGQNDTLKLFVESNIDCSLTFDSGNNSYFKIGDPEKREYIPSDGRYAYRKVITIIPPDMNTDEAMVSANYVIRPAKTFKSNVLLQDLGTSTWAISQEYLKFLINGQPKSYWNSSAARIELGQVTAAFKVLEPNKEPYKVFDVDMDQAITPTSVFFEMPQGGWLESTNYISTQKKFAISVKDVYFDNDTAPYRDASVVVGAYVSGLKDPIRVSIPVRQTRFRYNVTVDGNNTDKLEFANHDYTEKSLSVNTLGRFKVSQTNARKWLSFGTVRENTLVGGTTDVPISPVGQNMYFTDNDNIIRVESEISSKVYREIDVKQGKFRLELADDAESPVSKLSFSDTKSHTLKVYSDGPWHAEILSKDGKDRNWIAFSGETSGKEATGENGAELKVSALNANLEEENEMEAIIRLVSDSTHPDGSRPSDDQIQVNARQLCFYIKAYLTESDRPGASFDERTLIAVPAYKKELNTYTFHIESSHEATVTSFDCSNIPGFLVEVPDTKSPDYRTTATRPDDAEEKAHKSYRMVSSYSDTKSAQVDVETTVRYRVGNGPEKTKTCIFSFQQDAYVNSMKPVSPIQQDAYNVSSDLKYDFDLTKEAGWTATVIEGAGWLSLSDQKLSTVSRDSDGTRQSLKINVEKNPTTVIRNGRISVSDNVTGKSQIVQVNQNQFVFDVQILDADGNDVTSSRQMLFNELSTREYSKNMYTLKVTSSGPLAINKSECNWLEHTTLSAPTINLSVPVNSNGSDRGGNASVYPTVLDEVSTAGMGDLIQKMNFYVHQDPFVWNTVLTSGGSVVVEEDLLSLTPVFRNDSGQYDSGTKKEFRIEISSSGPWSISKTGSDGISFSPSSGNGAIGGTTETVTVAIDNNRGASERNWKLKIDSGSSSSYTKSYQFSQNPVVIQVEGQPRTTCKAVDGLVRGNFVNAEDWLGLKVSKVLRDGQGQDCKDVDFKERPIASGSQYILNPKDNFSRTSRRWIVYFGSEYSDVELPFELTQEAFELTVPKDDVMFEAEDSSSKEVPVKCSGNWSYESSDKIGWLNISKDNDKLQLSVGKNSGAQRDAEVTVYSTNNPDIKETFKVIQKGK